MMMLPPIITALAPAFTGLILACRCLHVGTSAELAEQVVPTRPLPYFTGEPSSSALGAAPDDDEECGSQLGDDNLDMEQEADDEGNGEKDPAGDETLPDPSKLELLQEIIEPATHNQSPPAPKSDDKRGPSHLDGSSASSDLSVEDLDAKGAHPKKKGSTPTKASDHIPVSGQMRTWMLCVKPATRLICSVSKHTA